VNPPILPMLAKRVGELPVGGTWIFEPKWDGFRALVFRDGAEILIQSRDEKSLNRYFPELLEPLRSMLPARYVLDGEIVVAKDTGLDFEALQLRIHPAASRVKLLSQEIPASIVFFDMLCEGNRDLRGEPFQNRRHELESLLLSAVPPVHLTPATHQSSVASDWFRRFEGAGLDGVVAKPVSGVYESDKRVMLKVKHERDCDCVVAGFRWHKKGDGTAVGSLLLGLFDDAGALQHVGVCASFTQEKRLELVEYLAPYRRDALAARTGGRGGLRAHAGDPLPSHGTVSEVAHGQEAGRLHLRPARSGSAAGADGDFLDRPLTLTRPVSSQRVSTAIRALDRRPGREFPAAAGALRAHGAGSLGCGSRWMTYLA
jgi:ATP-dependent DNA ligase